MDITKVKAAFETLNNELSIVTDAQVRARKTSGLASLIAAGKHIEQAEKLLDRAVKQTAPKASA